MPSTVATAQYIGGTALRVGSGTNAEFSAHWFCQAVHAGCFAPLGRLRRLSALDATGNGVRKGRCRAAKARSDQAQRALELPIGGSISTKAVLKPSKIGSASLATAEINRAGI
jgi:hypothetical protein